VKDDIEKVPLEGRDPWLTVVYGGESGCEVVVVLVLGRAGVQRSSS
jgi:hypothetical protein